MNHREESLAVKEALVKAGYRNVKVKHGTGTAYGWLDIWAESDEDWQTIRGNVIRIAKQVTGRHGDYDGEINVY